MQQTGAQKDKFLRGARQAALGRGTHSGRPDLPLVWPPCLTSLATSCDRQPLPKRSPLVRRSRFRNVAEEAGTVGRRRSPAAQVPGVRACDRGRWRRHVGPAPRSAPAAPPAWTPVTSHGAGAGRRARGGPGDSGGAGRESELGGVGGAMATVDLEKLRTSGAGKAIGVLTSGGDAQGGCWRAAGRPRAAGVLPGPLGRAGHPRPALEARGQPVPQPGSASRPLPVLVPPSGSPFQSCTRPDAPGPRTCHPPRPLRPARRGCVCAAGCGRDRALLPPGRSLRPFPVAGSGTATAFPGGHAARKPRKAGQVPAGRENPALPGSETRPGGIGLTPNQLPGWLWGIFL